MLRIGMIAPEFPPEIGGMHALAIGFANALGRHDEVTVYSPERIAAASPGQFRQQRLLSGQLFADVARLRAEPVDLWLGMNGGLLPLLARLTAPRFVYLHGNDFLSPWIGYGSWWLEAVQRPYMRRFRHRIRRRAASNAARCVCLSFVNSERTAELASKTLGLAPDRIAICPPGVDDEFFQDSSPGQDGLLRLVTVTRLTRYTRRKNVDGVLRGLASLRSDVDFQYTIVGDGDDRERLEALAAELGIADLVRFTGRLQMEDLRACYRAADLFVLASNATDEDVEGFGIVYIEANASGVPVICSRAGGAIDAVQDGVSGILIPDSTPSAIADGIRQFLRERERYDALRIKAWAERYRWCDVAAKLRLEMVHALASGTIHERGKSQRQA